MKERKPSNLKCTEVQGRVMHHDKALSVCKCLLYRSMGLPSFRRYSKCNGIIR